MRILSVLPSATEIVFALGRGGDLVGRSEECDFPPPARNLPVVMRAKRPAHVGSSRAIDDEVRSSRSKGESLYRLDLDALAALRPEVILTQDLCGVCSVTPDEVTAACRATGLDPTIVALTPRTLDDVWNSVRVIGEAIGASLEGERLTSGLRRRASAGPIPGEASPRVAVVEWLDPPILAGLWTPDMVTAAGGTYLGPDAGEVGERTAWNKLAEREPDLVILSPCSFPVERTATELKDSEAATILAAASPRLGVWLADEAFFSRPGPRLANGVELVRALSLGGAVPSAPPVRRWGAATRPVAA